MRRISTVVKSVLLRAWIVGSVLWISYVGLVVVLRHRSAGEGLSFSLLMALGPPAIAFLGFRGLLWILSPLRAATEDRPLLASQDDDFIWRLGLWQRFALAGKVIDPILALWFFIGWPVYGIYHLWKMENPTFDDFALYFGLPWFVGWLLLYPLRWVGRRFLVWLLPESQ